MTNEPLPLTLEEVAKRLRVNERTVLRLLDRKELRGYKVGRVWRIDPSDLEDYIRRQKAASDGESDPQRGPASSEIRSFSSQVVSEAPLQLAKTFP